MNSRPTAVDTPIETTDKIGALHIRDLNHKPFMPCNHSATKAVVTSQLLDSLTEL